MRTAVIVIAVALGLAAAWWMRRGVVDRDASSGSAAASSTSSHGTGAPATRVVTPGSAANVAGAQGHGPAPAVRDSHPLVRDPRQPGYDAARLFGTRLNDARGIFEAEPRDESWAKPREAAIEQSSLEAFKSVDPRVRMAVECHTGTCRVRVFSKLSYLNNQMAPYPLMCLASYAEPDWGSATAEDPFSDFYLMFGEATHGEGGFDAQRGTTCGKYRDDWVRQAPR